jgi:hypothetical protein
MSTPVDMPKVVLWPLTAALWDASVYRREVVMQSTINPAPARNWHALLRDAVRNEVLNGTID